MKYKFLMFVMLLCIFITACNVTIKTTADEETRQTDEKNPETVTEQEIILTENNQKILSPKEAVDYVASIYFDESEFDESFENEDGFGYRFKNTNHYITCEGYYENESGKFYVIHVYEVVIDDEETGDAHTATYNWYDVNAETKEITSMFYYDENGELQLNPNY